MRKVRLWEVKITQGGMVRLRLSGLAPGPRWSPPGTGCFRRDLAGRNHQGLGPGRAACPACHLGSSSVAAAPSPSLTLFLLLPGSQEPPSTPFFLGLLSPSVLFFRSLFSSSPSASRLTFPYCSGERIFPCCVVNGWHSVVRKWWLEGRAW